MRIYSLTVALIRLYAFFFGMNQIANLVWAFQNVVYFLTSPNQSFDSYEIDSSGAIIWGSQVEQTSYLSRLIDARVLLEIGIPLILLCAAILLWNTANAIAQRIVSTHEDDEIDGEFIVYENTLEIVGISLLGLYLLASIIPDWLYYFADPNKSSPTFLVLISALLVSCLFLFAPNTVQDIIGKFRATDAYGIDYADENEIDET